MQQSIHTIVAKGEDRGKKYAAAGGGHGKSASGYGGGLASGGRGKGGLSMGFSEHLPRFVKPQQHFRPQASLMPVQQYPMHQFSTLSRANLLTLDTKKRSLPVNH